VGLAQTNGEVRQVLGSSLFATVEGERGMGRGVRSDVQGGEVGGGPVLAVDRCVQLRWRGVPVTGNSRAPVGEAGDRVVVGVWLG
jgi:hypothetical protein